MCLSQQEREFFIESADRESDPEGVTRLLVGKFFTGFVIFARKGRRVDVLCQVQWKHRLCCAVSLSSSLSFSSSCMEKCFRGIHEFSRSFFLLNSVRSMTNFYRKDSIWSLSKYLMNKERRLLSILPIAKSNEQILHFVIFVCI